MQKSKPYVLIKSFPLVEILSFFFIFLGLFVFFFPRGELEKRLTQQQADTSIDLTIVYLENLSKVLKTPQVFHALCSRYALKGEYSKAFKILDEMKKLFPTSRTVSLETEYFLLKHIFISTKDEKEKKNLLHRILQITEELMKITKNPVWLRNSIEYFMSLREYDAVKELLNEYLKYCNTTECSLFIIKTGLATGDPQFAGKIAIEITKSRDIIDETSNF